MNRSKYFTRTKNSKNKVVQTSNNHQYAEATLGIRPGSASDEQFSGEEVKITLTQLKNGTLAVGITPMSPTENVEIMLHAFSDIPLPIAKVNPATRTIHVPGEEGLQGILKGQN